MGTGCSIAMTTGAPAPRTAQARCYGQVALTEKLEQWAERSYVNGFLLPLADRFGDHVQRLDAWRCTQLAPQRTFFDTYV